MKKQEPIKLFYRIGEVAQAVGVETHVLRYWESEFGSIRPQKSARGQRVYSHKDLERLLRVKELLHGEGYTIAGARKKMREDVASARSEAAEAAQSVPHSGLVKMRHDLLEIRADIQSELDGFKIRS